MLGKTNSTFIVVLGAFLMVLGSARAQTNTFPSTGNVGIGTTNPGSKLQVNGYKNFYVSYLIAADTGSFGDPSSFYLLLHPAYASTIVPEHYVMGKITSIRGGTTSWNRKVSCDINTASAYGSNRGTVVCNMENWSLVTLVYNGIPYLALQAPVASVLYNIEFTGYFQVQSGDIALTPVASASVSSVTPFLGDTVSVNGGGYFSGAVGVGTTTPGAMLEVNGNVKLTSGSGASITFPDASVQSTAWTGVLCGGDYAESVDVTGERTSYEPGDVLIIDPHNPGRFAKSAEPYSTAVTGVYSTKPGAVGRRQVAAKNQPELPMAMIGIVPTKVTAENGPIKPGDILVSSHTPGRAMKGTDRSLFAGAVIGKALGSLDSGTGVIEVVVSLQ